MNDTVTIHAQAEAIRSLFETHMGVRAKTLQAAVRRAGRRLPRGLRSKAAVLVEALEMSENPKLARRLDYSATKSAYRDLVAYLETLDLKEERRTQRLNLLAGIAFNLLILGVLVLLWLRWQGLA